MINYTLLRILSLGTLMVVCHQGLADEKIEKAKSKPSRFRIGTLASEHRDALPITTARKMLADLHSSVEGKTDLTHLAAEGQAPPAGKLDGQRSGKYGWAELDPVERRHYGLEKGQQDDYRADLRKEARKARDNGEPFSLKYESALCWSRPCRNKDLSEKERQSKEIDVFVLIREIDASQAITEIHLKTVEIGKDFRGRPCLDLRLTKEGGERMKAFTQANVPDEAALDAGRRFYLAVLVENKVICTPSLGGIVEDSLQITGNFKPGELEAYVNKLRGGR